METKLQNQALRFSVIDGALSAVMGSLAGGIFLMGFALKILAAQPQQIGILAALPMVANLVQIFGSYVIERTGDRKTLCFFSVLVSRAFWILIIILPLRIFSPLHDFRIWVLVAVIACSSLFGSLAGVAWLAWMSDLVPENIRGTYFGRRNMIASACGLVSVLLAGKFLTLWEVRFSESNPFGFVIIFVLGLAAGLAAVYFLIRMPEVESKKREAEGDFNFSVFLRPLRDANFLSLVLFVSSWMFAVQIAGPFYGVFMIENLRINFSAIAVFGALATLATLLMMKIWGPISDRSGNKPVIIVSSWVLITVPFLWVFALPGKYYLPVLAAHVLSGAFMAGAALSQFNILIKLSPQEGRSVYLALYSAITGSAGAAAPIIGGVLSRLLEKYSFSLLNYNITNLHLIFLMSSGLQILAVFLILRVKEPAAAAPVAVIMQLKNDLNPQTGIAGAADLLMVELKKSESLLKKLDRVTDEMAEKAEEKVEKAISRGEDILGKPIKKLKDFLQGDE